MRCISANGGGVASRILWLIFGIASLYLLISGARVFGYLRAGRDLRLAVDVHKGVAQSVQVKSDLLTGQTVQLTPALKGGRLEFDAVASRSDNSIVVSLTDVNGATDQNDLPSGGRDLVIRDRRPTGCFRTTPSPRRAL
jgi:hypothetical protein